MNKAVVILSAGPPRRENGVVRHLETFHGKPLISIVVTACETAIKRHLNTTTLHIVVSAENIQMIQFMQNHFPNIHIHTVTTHTMLETFKCALNVAGCERDTLLVAGDLHTITSEDVEKFLNSPFPSAVYRLKHPWDPKDLVSQKGNLIRRSDIGDSLVLIANSHKSTFLSEEMIAKAKMYFSMFYPDQQFSETLGNFLWTWLDYAFFFEISSCRNHTTNQVGLEKGTIYLESKVYLDND